MRKAAAVVRVVRAKIPERREKEKRKQRWMMQILQTKSISPNGRSFKKELKREPRIKNQIKDHHNNLERNSPRGRKGRQKRRQTKRWPHRIKHGESRAI
eukprot:10623094-Karenia_brevis.AAC.1